MHDTPYFIDFEASSLSHDSWPIEIAWGSNTDNITSCLISPAAVPAWTDWSVVAQEVHGIPRHELLNKGLPPAEVCEKVYAGLNNKIVYSDAPRFDGYWLYTLFEGGQLPQPQFQIRDIHELLIAELSLTLEEQDDIIDHIENSKRIARDKVKIQHRADYDVAYLIELWKLCGGTPA
ncbi:MAG: hypothetical protein OEZ39_18460 [Gammaproteobacteria bacterium]|nr:hypothetical protein [Gammaproteobacteria bacterium]